MGDCQALGDRSGNSAGRKGHKDAWPEASSQQRKVYCAKVRVMLAEGLSPLVRLDHSDTVSAKSQKSSSFVDRVVTLWKNTEGKLARPRPGARRQQGEDRLVKVKCELQ